MARPDLLCDSTHPNAPSGLVRLVTECTPTLCPAQSAMQQFIFIPAGSLKGGRAGDTTAEGADWLGWVHLTLPAF
jgi:hypothetical protein